MRRLVRHRGAAIGALLIAGLLLAGLLAPVITPHAPNDLVGAPNLLPTLQHPFGTNRFGQDVFGRTLYGAQFSFQVALLAALGGTVVGTTVGAYAAYRGGWIDAVMQRLLDAAIAFPPLLVLLLAVRFATPSSLSLMAIVGAVLVPGVARVVRSAAVAARSADYVRAAEALGASGLRVFVQHLLLNLAPIAIVLCANTVATAILAETTLSFLGLGASTTTASWGADINSARAALPANVPAMIAPGLAIVAAVLGFNLLGDSLRDIWDPRLRGSR